MSRITIYLPPRLKAAVKAADLPVSAICQDALRHQLAACKPAGKPAGGGGRQACKDATVEAVAP